MSRRRILWGALHRSGGNRRGHPDGLPARRHLWVVSEDRLTLYLLRRRVTISILLALVASLLIGTPVLAYLYRSQVSISNNTSTAYPMLSVNWTANNQWMEDNGLFGAGANTTRVQTLGGLNKPHMVSDTRTLTAVPIPANSQTNLYFVTGESAQAMKIITGRSGYLTTANATNLEHGANFTDTISGYIDTSILNSVIIQRAGAYRVITGNVSGNITAGIYGSVGALTQTLYPVATGNYTNIAYVTGSATHWGAVDDPSGAPDDDVTYVSNDVTVMTQTKDAYQLTDPVLGTFDTINSVTVYYRFTGYTNVSDRVGYAQPFLRLDGVGETAGTETSQLGLAYTTNNEVLARPGGGSWTAQNIKDLQVAIGIRNNGLQQGSVHTTQVYVVMSYYPGIEVSVAGIPSGEMIVQPHSDSTNFWLTVDTPSTHYGSANMTTIAVPNNANSYTIGSNVTPYFNYITMDVGGNQQLYYAPNEMVIGTTLPDRGSDTTSNPATITWGTNTAGVTVSVGSMTSSGQPTIGAVTPDPARDSLPVAGGGDWNIEPDVSGTLLTNPFRPIIVAVSDNTSLTERQAWVWSGIAFVIMVFGVAARSLKGHVGLAGVATGVALVINVVLTVFPIIILPFAILLIVGGLVSERSS